MTGGEGLVAFDWVMLVLCIIAAAGQYWLLAEDRGKMVANVLIGRWCMALGWSALALRVGYLVYMVGDPSYPPAVLIAISLLAVGSVMVNFSVSLTTPIVRLFSTPRSRDIAKAIGVTAVVMAGLFLWLVEWK